MQVWPASSLLRRPSVRLTGSTVDLSFACLSVAVFVYLIAPIFVVIPISFSSASYLEFPPRGLSLQWYEEYFGSPQWIAATFVSMKVALGTMALSTLLGTLAAFALVRSSFRLKPLLYSLILAPLIVPVVILAVGLYGLYSGWHWIGTLRGLIFAHTTLALPFVVLTVAATLQTLDMNLERAARSMGASRLMAFLTVIFPLIRSGVLSGAVFAFIASWDEIVIAIFISGTMNATLPKQMWDGIRQEVNPTIAAISSMLVGLSVAAMVCTEMLRRRVTERKSLPPAV